MPLDGTNYRRKIKPLATGLAGLKQLGDALREPLPIRWDFSTSLKWNVECGSYGCALGVARILWPEQVHNHLTANLAMALGLPKKDLGPIFGTSFKSLVFGTGPYGSKLNKFVTPTDVADAIDRYIERREAEERAA